MVYKVHLLSCITVLVCSIGADADVPALEPKLFHRTPLKVPYNPEDYVVKQVFVASKDGTKVPMFVAHRKAAKLGPSTPAVLYGYGGFDVSIQPRFSAKWCACWNFCRSNLIGCNPPPPPPGSESRRV